MGSNMEKLISLWVVVASLLLLVHAIEANLVIEQNEWPTDSLIPSKAQRGNSSEQSLAVPIGPVNNIAVFDVTNYGAIGDGSLKVNISTKEDLNVKAFVEAWKSACHKTGLTKVLIPPGDYVLGRLSFEGPCSSQITVDNQGSLSANTDINAYHAAAYWIQFKSVNNLTFTGPGQINAHGSANWNRNDCKTNKHCPKLPKSIVLNRVNHSVIDGITSVDSMLFHMFVCDSVDVTIQRVRLVAPSQSPNTDGIHTCRSRLVKIYDSYIGTGDDCVSVGEGSTDISVNNVTCGPGHGLSIGSLGSKDGEGAVQGITMTNCTLNMTANGLRIKTQKGLNRTTVQHIVYDNIAMFSVKNPIIIDSAYDPNHRNVSQVPSHVNITDVRFSNIRGTSATADLVTLNCSQAIPCTQISLQNIQLQPPHGTKPNNICNNVAPTICNGN